jgi:hypothetical protein
MRSITERIAALSEAAGATGNVSTGWIFSTACIGLFLVLSAGKGGDAKGFGWVFPAKLCE